MLVEILFQFLIDVLNAERLHDLPRQKLAALHLLRDILALIHIEQPVNGIRQRGLCLEGIAKLQVRVGGNRPGNGGGDIGGRCHAAQFVPILLLLQFNGPFQQAVLVYKVAVLLVVPLDELWRDTDNLLDNLFVPLIVVCRQRDIAAISVNPVRQTNELLRQPFQGSNIVLGLFLDGPEGLL